ncbi:MAG: M28 family peptidase [Pirellulales bacterium]
MNGVSARRVAGDYGAQAAHSDRPLRRRLSARQMIALSAALVAALAAGWWTWNEVRRPAEPAGETAAVPAAKLLADIPFDGAQAYEYLKQICELGPRPSGSAGMAEQQKLLVEHFSKLGVPPTAQRFRYRHPLTGQAVEMANLIVSWHPERQERILLCAHYDTRPYPDQDPRNPNGVFLGANDGASGVALLMELGRHMPSLGGKYGVDFVFFDGEEFVFNDTDPYFLGSEWFSRQYVAEPPAHRYRWGVLLDMVADAQLQVFQERNSVLWPDTKPLVDSIWSTARRLGVREFIPRVKHEVRDDHLKLRNIAKIPTCDVIDFDYPYWHTEADTPAHCSPLSLAKVGWVVLEWLGEPR